VASDLVSATCPVCGGKVASLLFDGGKQPLATLAWPTSKRQAKNLPLYPLDFVQCPKCTHIWNHRFKYDDIPYRDNPNRMFNKGKDWNSHLKHTAGLLLNRLSKDPVVVDIGCGEGGFLRYLHEMCPNGRYIGFDPNNSDKDTGHIHFEQRLLDPLADLPELQPDAITIRHVLEHLTDPSDLVEQLKWAASYLKHECILFVEVPCVDKVLEHIRLADFYYEHVSNFTTRSFKVMMERAGHVQFIQHGYGSEVAFAMVDLQVSQDEAECVVRATKYRDASKAAIDRVSSQLSALVEEDLTLAIWGGTGKAAAFMQYYQVDADRFPLVVDSDIDKVGTYVPGVGQKIQYRDVLRDMSVDCIVIPAQWRAKDIVKEIADLKLSCDQVLIEHDGSLIDYFNDAHPYH